jgi:hypothetical protein
MRVTCSTVGMNCAWLLVEWRLVHGTFGCWWVTISLSHTKVLSNFGRMWLKLVTFIWICMRMACLTVGMNYGWLLIERRLGHGKFWLLTGHYFVISHYSFGPHATDPCQVHSIMNESGLRNCRNQIWFVFDQAAACTRYVCVLTSHYCVISH